MQALGHDPHSHWQHDGGGHSESPCNDGGYSRVGGTRCWLSEVVTPNQIAAGGHVVVVHPSLYHRDLECVHAYNVEVLQDGLYAGALVECGAMPRCRGSERLRYVARAARVGLPQLPAECGRKDDAMDGTDH